MLRKATFFSSRSRNPFSGHIANTIIFNLHVVSTALVLAQDGSVTCDVLPAEPMENTFLTCHFPEDVSQTRRDFTVQLLKEKESQEPVDVLDCWWISGKMECFLWPGYRYNTSVSDKLSLEILQASATKIGIYSCRLADMDPKHIKTCEFNIKLDGRTTCEISSVDLHAETSLTCYFPEDISQTKANFAVHHNSGAGETDAIVSCEWKGENLYCNTLRGYLFDHSATDHLTVRVPSVTENNEGSYSCQIKDDRRISYDTCYFALQTATTSSCHAVSVKELEPATLTCNFSIDVDVARRHFRVVRLGATGAKETYIAVCMWVEDQLDCSTTPGFEVNSVVSHQLIVSMPRAASEQNGTYACYLLGSRLDNFEPCEFIVTTDSHGDSFKPVTIGVTVTLIPLTLIIVMAVLLLKRRSRELQKNEGADESMPLMTQDGPGDEGEDNPCESYLILISDDRATPLAGPGSLCTFQEIENKTGGIAQFAPSPSPARDTKTVIIRGSPRQISDTVKLLYKKTGGQKAFSAQAQTFWLQWVQEALPDFDSRAYFLPPVHFNHVHVTRQSGAGQIVLDSLEALGKVGQRSEEVMVSSDPGQSSLLQVAPVQDNDVREDSAMQRVLFCLQKMSGQNKEVLVGLSQLQFGQYLGEPCYAPVAACLPLEAKLPPPMPRNLQPGDFDVLLIHRQFGFIVCEGKTFGDNINKHNMSQEDTENIRKKLKEAVSHLDKAEAMLSHLVSDVIPGLRVTKTIALPNLTARQVEQVISGDHQLVQELCRCLATPDLADITGLCLCSDQLSDPKTPWDVSSDVLRELGNWWQRRVAVSGPDSHMALDVYKTLIARFCGSATTVAVPCTSPPRLCVKTLGQTVSWTGECHTAQITLFPEQVDLINTAHPRVFVSGPPGTGKSVVLLLKGIEWLRCGNDVHIVSIWFGSHAACAMLYHLLLHVVKTQLTSVTSPSQLHLLQYEFDDDKNMDKAVRDLSQVARGGSLYVIADEAGPETTDYLHPFCDKLMTQVPSVHLWAASCYDRNPPAGWQVKYLTRPLRSPPAVIREVQQDEYFSRRRVAPYSERDVAGRTDGPPVKRLCHLQGKGHSGVKPQDCSACGRAVASFLYSLRGGVSEDTATTSSSPTSTSGGTTQPSLQWRDVLVLPGYKVTVSSGAVKALREAGIPVRVTTDNDIEDVATTRSDVVWVAERDHVRGLERKVIVCLGPVESKHPRLHVMSRCSAWLVIVSPEG